MSEIHVLLIADDPLDVVQTRLALDSEPDMVVEHCPSPDSARERLAISDLPPPDVLLWHGKRSGAEAIFRGLAEAGSPPVVVMADASESDQDWVSAGAADCLVRGASSIELSASLRRAAGPDVGSGEVWREFDLMALVYECLDVHAPEAHRRDLGLIAEIAPDASGAVVGPDRTLRRVVEVLVEQALAQTEEGRVVVRVRGDQDGRLTLEVADSGPGFDGETCRVLFEIPAEGQEPVCDAYARCGTWVRDLGGRISPMSVPGSGTVVVVDLPVSVSPGPSGTDLEGNRILTVLRDPIETALAVSRLRFCGAEITSAHDLDGARAILGSEQSFDAVLIDARLGDGDDGMELLDDLDHSRVHCCAVLLAVDAGEEDLARCEAAGVAPMYKPVRWEAIEQSLADQIELRRPVPRGAPRLDGFRVLLVEDVAENRMVALGQLRRTSCEASLAEDGVEALEVFRRERFDLVLMDIHMPRLDGREATRRMRAFENQSGQRRTPIVALTADVLPSQIQACLEAGCDAHLAKPLTCGALFDILEELLPDMNWASVDPAAAPSTPGDALDMNVPDDLAGLAEGYLDNRATDVRALREAAAAADLETARRIGHNMKGSGKGYGFPRISEIGAEIEVAAKQGDGDGVSRGADALAEYVEMAQACLSDAPIG